MLDVDLRVVVTASHPNIGVALSVTEPSGEKIRDGNNLSVYGGVLIENSRNLSQYMIRKAIKGKYKMILEHFDAYDNDEWESWEYIDDFANWRPDNETEENSDSNNDEKEKAAALAPGVVFVEIFTNYGRANETRRSLCITLDNNTETYEIGEVGF
ncbi:MAG: hypothetical protein LBQ50_12905 [Planctomycetaceae bacterium]|nr:hypothetical protein [Planctomycetaceae bacterium]